MILPFIGISDRCKIENGYLNNSKERNRVSYSHLNRLWDHGSHEHDTPLSNLLNNKSSIIIHNKGSNENKQKE